MKRFLPILALVLAAVGCHGQIPSNPTTYSCPTANTGTWTALETASTEVTATSVNTTAPGIGTFCFAVTSIINTTTPVAQSIASNVVMVTTTSALPQVDLLWTAPATGPAPTGYIAYYIAATATTLGAPALSAPTTAAEVERPAETQETGQLALLPPSGLKSVTAGKIAHQKD